MKRSILLTVFLLLLVVALKFFMASADWVEDLYAVSLYPKISIFLSFLWGWMPFSFGDLLYIFAIFYLLYLMFRLIVSRPDHRWTIGIRMINVALIGWLGFYLLWGLNYFRLPLAQRQSFPIGKIQDADFLEMTYVCLDSMIYYRDQAIRIGNIDRRSMEREAVQLWQNENSNHLNLKLKSSLFGKGVSKIGVSGYFNPFSNEAHVNFHQPLLTQPFTAVHELAHVQGMGFEDEANFYAFVLSVKSQDPRFQYAAYFEAFWNLLFQLYAIHPDLYAEVLKDVPTSIRDDRAELVLYWQSQSGWLQDVTFWFYEKLLKNNNQPAGLKTYGLFTSLLVANKLKHSNCQ